MDYLRVKEKDDRQKRDGRVNAETEHFLIGVKEIKVANATKYMTNKQEVGGKEKREIY